MFNPKTCNVAYFEGDIAANSAMADTTNKKWWDVNFDFDDWVYLKLRSCAMVKLQSRVSSVHSPKGDGQEFTYFSNTLLICQYPISR
ncbi:unnamed protein product [Citrullus colocynthis]|uniref:Uncharacterized protein n=1 Tax=Citrullus colocynthis TaxID=252529 RepID=A0ABP0Y4G9_9ROSI